MEILVHALGTCSDTHSHIDLLDIVFGGASGLGVYSTLKYYGLGIKLYIKSLLTK